MRCRGTFTCTDALLTPTLPLICATIVHLGPLCLKLSLMKWALQQKCQLKIDVLAECLLPKFKDKDGRKPDPAVQTSIQIDF